MNASEKDRLDAAASAMIQASQLAAGARDAMVSGDHLKGGIVFAEVRDAIKAALRHINDLSGNKYFNAGDPS